VLAYARGSDILLYGYLPGFPTCDLYVRFTGINSALFILKSGDQDALGPDRISRFIFLGTESGDVWGDTQVLKQSKDICEHPSCDACMSPVVS
jgi:hypothetical protein